MVDLFSPLQKFFKGKLSWPSPATGGEPTAYKTMHWAQSGHELNKWKINVTVSLKSSPISLSQCHALTIVFCLLSGTYININIPI